MKLFTCMAYADPRKIDYLAKVLKAQEHLMDEVHVSVITQLQGDDDIAAILACAPQRTERFTVRVYNEGGDQLPSPGAGQHRLLAARPGSVASPRPLSIVSSRRMEYGIAPMGHNRFLVGDEYSVSRLPRIELKDGSGYLNLPRTYQGMFLCARQLMLGHMQSASFNLHTFVTDWRNRIQHTVWPLGLTEAAVEGLTRMSVRPDCFSRNFIPFYTKYLMVDPCCFVHHLPDKYTNMTGSEHGRLFVDDLLAT